MTTKVDLSAESAPLVGLLAPGGVAGLVDSASMAASLPTLVVVVCPLPLAADAVLTLFAAAAVGVEPRVLIPPNGRWTADSVRSDIAGPASRATLSRHLLVVTAASTLSAAAWDGLLATLEDPPAPTTFMVCVQSEKDLPSPVRGRVGSWWSLAPSGQWDPGLFEGGDLAQVQSVFGERADVAAVALGMLGERFWALVDPVPTFDAGWLPWFARATALVSAVESAKDGKHAARMVAGAMVSAVVAQDAAVLSEFPTERNAERCQKSDAAASTFFQAEARSVPFRVALGVFASTAAVS